MHPNLRFRADSAIGHALKSSGLNFRPQLRCGTAAALSGLRRELAGKIGPSAAAEAPAERCMGSIVGSRPRNQWNHKFERTEMDFGPFWSNKGSLG